MRRNATDYDRTLIFCDAAVRRLRAHRHPALPRNYELWYTYATGYNAALNRAINEALERSPTITEDELDSLYETYLSPLRMSDRVDHVGSRILDEIVQVADILKDARGNTIDYVQKLESISERARRMGSAGGPLEALAQSLLAATNATVSKTVELERRLGEAQDEMQELHHALELVRVESLTDPLTGLANRKFLESTLDRALKDAADGKPFSVLVIDIDHFKTFNDTFGHLTGDQVLRLVALSLKQNVKAQDLAARFGGEEFAIVLGEADVNSAIAVAERVRRAVMTKDLVKRSTGEHLGRVTVSVGVATWRSGDTGQTVIDRADRCLYAAKRNGRNLVVAETDVLARNDDVANLKIIA